MIKYLLLIILPFSLYASKILSYNIYERSDRVDVMITFDTPYDGAIKQSVSDSAIIIKLEDALIESEKSKTIASNYVTSFSMSPMLNYTKIVATVAPSTLLSASKTSDAYGLRLRFTTKTATPENQLTQKNGSQTALDSLPTKKDDDMSQSYYIVISILIAGIVLLLFIKKRMAAAQNRKQNSSWLFKDIIQEAPQTPQSPHVPTQTAQFEGNEISIKFQKPINSENSVVLLDFGQQSYLVLIGKNNILLDKFTGNRPITQDDFNTILQNRNKELNDFLNMNAEPIKAPLQAYKERAASILYEA